MLAPPRALTQDEIVDLIERFGTAALIAEKAGFTGVEVHAAHGYLISEFLSPLANRRTDEWGGTPEKRRRFLIETIRAIRSKVTSRFALGVKLNSADFQRGGFSEEESMAVVEALTVEGVDLLQVTGGTFEAPVQGDGRVTKDSTLAREAYFLEYAGKVRRLAAMPLMLSGGIRTAETMARVVRDGSVDVVGLARPLAVFPDLPNAVLGGQPAPFAAPRRTRWRLLDLAVDTRWYNQQIRRLGRGKDPDPGRGLLRMLLPEAATAIRWRLGMNR